MIISINHCCGHASPHVLYGSKDQLSRQREELRQTRCPDCFYAKVLRLMKSNGGPVAVTGRRR